MGGFRIVKEIAKAFAASAAYDEVKSALGGTGRRTGTGGQMNRFLNPTVSCHR